MSDDLIPVKPGKTLVGNYDLQHAIKCMESLAPEQASGLVIERLRQALEAPSGWKREGIWNGQELNGVKPCVFDPIIDAICRGDIEIARRHLENYGAIVATSEASREEGGGGEVEALRWKAAEDVAGSVTHFYENSSAHDIQWDMVRDLAYEAFENDGWILAASTKSPTPVDQGRWEITGHDAEGGWLIQFVGSHSERRELHEDAVARVEELNSPTQEYPSLDQGAASDLLEWAWGIICNVSEGQWDAQPTEWIEAARNFREKYHAYLDSAVATQSPDPDQQGAAGRWVRQEDDDGCTVAALAMLTGKTYAEAKAAYWRDDRHPTPSEIQADLMEAGFSVRVVYSKREQGQWPPLPFAPMHFVQVAQESGRGHAVVMDARGVVLDPLREGAFSLTDWPVVNHVIGVWPATTLEVIRAAAQSCLVNGDRRHIDGAMQTILAATDRLASTPANPTASDGWQDVSTAKAYDEGYVWSARYPTTVTRAKLNGWGVWVDRDGDTIVPQPTHWHRPAPAPKPPAANPTQGPEAA